MTSSKRPASYHLASVCDRTLSIISQTSSFDESQSITDSAHDPFEKSSDYFFPHTSLRRRKRVQNLYRLAQLQRDERPIHKIVRDHIWGAHFDQETPVSAEEELFNLSLIHIKPIYNEIIDEMTDRLITQTNSRLTKHNVANLLLNEQAWSSLDEETQRGLYEMLPKAFNDKQYPVDVTVHPLKSPFAKYIKHFIYEWEQDLINGRNTAKWQREAKQATGERLAGAFDAERDRENEQQWGDSREPSQFKFTMRSEPDDRASEAA